jgi:hypothetical protein
MCKLHSTLRQTSCVLGVLVAGVAPSCCSSLVALHLVACLALSCLCIVLLAALGQLST